MKIRYQNFNGDLIQESSKLFDSNNRLFCYGDGIFETIHACGSSPQFLYEHYKRIERALIVLGIEIPFNLNQLEKEIEKTLAKNRIYKGARVRLAIYRNDGGLYAPTNNTSSFLIETSDLEFEKYALNSKGLNIGIYSEMKKPVNILSPFKTSNALLFVLAGLYKSKNDFDDCIILNDNGAVCEAISSNLFFVKGKTIVTPSVKSGCVSGIMRVKVLEIADFLGYSIVEQDNVDVSILQKADEVFLSNAISGVRWVLSYRRKRYTPFVAKKITEALNQIVFS